MAALLRIRNSRHGRKATGNSPQRKLQKDSKEDLKDEHTTESELDPLVNKINCGTKKCTNFIHLGKLFANYPQECDHEEEPAFEVPALLQCNIQSSDSRKTPLSFENKSLDDVLRDDKRSMWLFFGSGGSGKTTLLKTIARHTMNKVYEGLRDVSIVIFLKCGDLSMDKYTSLFKLLLSNIEPEIEEAELIKFKETICGDPSKLLIVLDGLDMLPRTFYSKGIQSVPQIDEENASVADILAALLSSKCLAGCHIVASSQTLEIYQKIPKLFNDMIPVQLKGLTEESIYNIVKQHLEQCPAERLMQLLESQPGLLDLCRTPVFLIASVLGQRENSSFMPTNASDTLIYLVGQFIRSAPSEVEENEIKSLAKVAFELLRDGKFDFNPDMLSHYHLIQEKLSGLLHEQHCKGNRSVSFIHQSIQEMLATLHLVGLEKSSFEKEVKNWISQDEFLFQCLCGLLCNQDTFALASDFELVHEDGEWEPKRRIVMEILRRRVDLVSYCKYEPLMVLDTVHILNECESKIKNDVASRLKNICINSYPLSLTDVHALSSVTVSSLDQLVLSSCALELQHLIVLGNFFMCTKKKVRKLDLSHNRLTPDAMKIAGKIAGICLTEELNISGIAGTQTDHTTLLSLKMGLGDHKLKVLKINYSDANLEETEMNVDTEVKTLERVYKLVPGDEHRHTKHIIPDQLRCCEQIFGSWKTASYDITRAIEKLMSNVTESIHVHCWKFSDEWKEILQNSLKVNGRQNLQIVLSSRCTIQFDGERSTIVQWEDEGDKEMVDMLQPDRVLAESTCDEMGNDLNITVDESHEHVEDLVYQIAHRTVKSSDLSAFRLEITKHNCLEEIELRDCGLSGQFLHDLLNEVTRRIGNVQVKKLSITAENKVTELIPAICQLMVSCNTDNLNLEESDGSVMMMKILHEHVKKQKVRLKVLNLSYIQNLGGFDHLGGLLSGRVCELHLVDCNLDLSSMESLQCITNSQVNYLDISYNREIDEDSIRLIPGIVCKNECLSLVMQGCELDEYDVDAFKEFGDIQLQLLDLSYNETLQTDGIEKVGQYANDLQVKELRLSSCGIDKCIANLASFLHQKLDSLDLSKNPRVASHTDEIARLIGNSKLLNLSLSDCGLIYTQIERLATSMKEQEVKLKQVDIRDRSLEYWDEKYSDAVQSLSSCVEEKFSLCLPCDDNNKFNFQDYSLPWMKRFPDQTIISRAPRVCELAFAKQGLV